MPQDLFTIKRSVKYLSQQLVGAKVNKIFQPSSDEIDLAVYHGGVFRLVISSSAKFSRVSISNKEKPNPEVAPNFCMLLRKHLTGAEIKGVSLAFDDRIIKISLTALNDFYESENLELYAEIMGKHSNIFLVKNGVILGMLKSAPQELDATRLTLVGAKYTPPAKQNKLLASKENALKVFSEYSGGDLSKFILLSFLDFAPVTASEIAYLIDKSGDYSPSNMANILAEFLDRETNPVVIDDGIKKDAFAFDYLSLSGKREFYPNLHSAFESVYGDLEEQKDLLALKNSLLNPAKNYQKRLQKRLQEASEITLGSEDIARYKLFGELIISYTYLLKKGMKKAELLDYSSGEEKLVTVELDELLTPQQNANKYFKKYRKKKTALDYAKKQESEIKNELNYLSSVIFSIDNAKQNSEIEEIKQELILSGVIKEKSANKKKKPIKSQPIKYLIDGVTVLVGKNNLQNEQLLDLAGRNDIWLHVKSYHSSHVIIKAESEVTNSVLLTAAEICAYRSEANGGGTVAVDYTLRRFVKKPQGSKPGSVIYTDFKTLLVTPNEHKDKIAK